MQPGEALPGFAVTPDRYLPHRYAGAAEDFNPLHLDAEFARSVGLPRNILHGLYTMGLVARAGLELTDGDPRRLRRLSVQFRAVGLPEEEISVRRSVRERSEQRVVLDVEADQGERALIRRGVLELEDT
jgi:acyl dehydratase